MIRILHIVKSLYRGGAEMLLPETLKLHDQSRYKFYYIYFFPSHDLSEAIMNAGGKVEYFQAENNIKIMLQGEKIVNFCKINKIDIIHCHLPLAGFVGRYVFKRLNIPLIYTEHNIQEKYHFITKVFNKFTYNSQTLAIGVSKDVTRSINEHIAPKIPVHTLFNGVNTNFFQRDSGKRDQIKKILNIPEEALVVGNIAVFREQKSLLEWVKAFDIISKENSNVYGLLVGSGPEEEKIKRLVSKLDLNDKLKLPGQQVDTIPYFSAMDVFMISSEFEGLPLALLEAMSMKCAIVSTRAGGIPEAVGDKIEGFLCDVGDWKCLAAKTLELLSKEDKRLEFQIAGRKRVQRDFSLETMVSNLERIYREVLL